MSEWDHDVLDDDLDDDLGDDEGLLGDDDDSVEAELSSDYAVPDRDIQALSGERGAALDRPTLLGSAVRLDGMPDDDSKKLRKLLRGGADIKCITIEFTNGRKLHVIP